MMLSPLRAPIFCAAAIVEFFLAWGNLSMQWGADRAAPQLIASMSSNWLFLGGLLSSRAHLRFASQTDHAKTVA